MKRDVNRLVVARGWDRGEGGTEATGNVELVHSQMPREPLPPQSHAGLDGDCCEPRGR